MLNNSEIKHMPISFSKQFIKRVNNVKPCYYLFEKIPIQSALGRFAIFSIKLPCFLVN